jgi:hypothetical protein
MTDQSLYVARTVSKKRINYEGVRIALHEIKQLMRSEPDEENKILLAKAGEYLNKLLLK